ERNWENQRFLFPTVKPAVTHCRNLRPRGIFPEVTAHVLERLDQETGRPAAGIVNRLRWAWIDSLYDGADQRTRREELATVIALFSHLEQQTFVNLTQRKQVVIIVAGQIERMNAVQDIPEVAVGLRPGLFGR